METSRQVLKQIMAIVNDSSQTNTIQENRKQRRQRRQDRDILIRNLILRLVNTCKTDWQMTLNNNPINYDKEELKLTVQPLGRLGAFCVKLVHKQIDLGLEHDSILASILQHLEATEEFQNETLVILQK